MRAGTDFGAKVTHVLLHKAQYFLNLRGAIRQRSANFRQLLFDARILRR